MASLSIFIVALAVASSEDLPDALKTLANSTDAFAASIAKLDKKTDAVVADAALTDKVASNKTARKAVLDYMGSALAEGMPSSKAYEKADDAAIDAAGALQKADLEAKQAKLALVHARHWAGDSNLTPSEQEGLEKLRNASRDADENLVAAKKELRAKVEKAKSASKDLLEATHAYAKTFDEHVDELLQAARRHEAAAKKAMRGAIAEGRKAAQKEMKDRKMSEQTGEEARGKAEEWAEDHEEAIERASDSAHDDLERVYEPVKRMVADAKDDAEREDRSHRDRLDRLLEKGERVELVQVVGEQEEIPQGSSWMFWGAGYSAVAVGALLVAASRRRVGVDLQQPLLG
jgi:hypothetical protein